MDAKLGTIRTGILLDDKYVLEHLIGQGGGGKVFRAVQQSTGQAVAVKLLEPDLCSSESADVRRRQRFRREMEICARLEHPDVVGLIDYGEVDDLLYTVFELVPGQTLRQQLTLDGALSVAESCTIMRQLLGVLSYAHARGVIHRDLKPSNLMMVREGSLARIKVLDFGVSAMFRSASGTTLTRLTSSNEMVGTPAYAAPEQLRGDAPTPKTDLYAAGLIMLECLTGASAIKGTSLGEVFQNQLSLEPVEIPDALREHSLGVLLRSVLEKAPVRRAGSAEAVLERLAAIDIGSLGQLVDDNGYLVQRAAARALPNAAGVETRTTPAGRLEGERRQVSALCCRLSFRASGEGHVDDALLDAHRNDLFALCQATIEEFGGVLVGGFGDLALYYFGVPRASDTDSRMAARAALELSGRVGARSKVIEAQLGISVVLQAGLHSGLLTAAQASAAWAFAHGSVAAVAVALAQRSGTSVDTSIRVSEAFRALMSRHGEFSTRREVEGTLALPWCSTELSTHQLTSESLSDAYVQAGAPLSGRADELSALVEAWRGSSDRARVVLLRGEAGMGKSRLAQELRGQVRGSGHSAVMLRFVPELEHIALGPVMELLRSELGLGARPSLAELAAALAGFEVDLELAVPLLCAWTSTALEAPYVPHSFSPQKQRAMLFELLREILTASLSRRRGYLLIEDLHWADPSTLEWLGKWFAGLEPGGFALLTARPDFVPRWEGVEVLELQALSNEQVAQMVAALPDGAALGPDVVAEIVARADGVPLFVEELVRVFAARRGAVTGRTTWPEVPATLRSLMMSRLDALGAAKETAQFAAAISREFDVELLFASMIGKQEANLLADLSELVSAGILLVHRQLGRHGYVFRHALLRDAAYESMTSSGLQQVHSAIAHALLAEFPERVDVRPDLLAHHLERGGVALQSAEYWMQATKKAALAGAHQEALGHIAGGVRALEGVAERAVAHDRTLDFRVQEMSALMAKYQGMPSPEFSVALGHAVALLEHQPATDPRVFDVRRGEWFFLFTTSRLDQAQEAARGLLGLAEASAIPLQLLAAQTCMCQVAFFRGDCAEVLTQFEACAALYPTVEGDFVVRVGNDPYIDCASFASMSMLLCGSIAASIEIHEDVLVRARALSLPGLLAGILANSGSFYALAFLGEDDSTPQLACAQQRVAEAAKLAVEAGYPLWQLIGEFWGAIIPAMAGGAEFAPMLLGIRDMFLARPLGLTSTLLLLFLSKALDRCGERAAALALVDITLAYAETSGERFVEAELLRTRAGLLGPGHEHERAALLGAALERARRGRVRRLYEARIVRDLDALGIEHASLDPIEIERLAHWWRESGALESVPSLRRWLSSE